MVLMLGDLVQTANLFAQNSFKRNDRIYFMVLTTHAVAGATLATLVPNHPLWGFVIGFGSHFVLDSIPHWDYSLKSKKEIRKIH